MDWKCHYEGIITIQPPLEIVDMSNLGFKMEIIITNQKYKFTSNVLRGNSGECVTMLCNFIRTIGKEYIINGQIYMFIAGYPMKEIIIIDDNKISVAIEHIRRPRIFIDNIQYDITKKIDPFAKDEQDDSDSDSGFEDMYSMIELII